MPPEEVEVYHWGTGKWMVLSENPWLTYLKARKCDFRRRALVSALPGGEGQGKVPESDSSPLGHTESKGKR